MQSLLADEATGPNTRAKSFRSGPDFAEDQGSLGFA